MCTLHKGVCIWGTYLHFDFLSPFEVCRKTNRNPNKVTSEGPHCKTKETVCSQW